MIPKLLDEFDIPQRSAWSGYEPDSADIPVRSIYKYMVEHNQCNHRDYQNMGVNGARSTDLLSGKDIEAIQRDPETDKPMLVILELIGNDVCNGHHDFTHMTTPDNFKAHMLKNLDYLNTRLPKGSHVVSVGLAQGSLLYEVLENRTHPIGVGYPQFYDYLNCMEVSPCWGWMNSNATVRNLTTQRALELNQVYRDIIAENYTWSNFDYDYYDLPALNLLKEYERKGGDPFNLIEHVDGFHPSQTLNAMFGDYFWEHLSHNHSDWFGAPNPNNEKITEIFGNQGGY